MQILFDPDPTRPADRALVLFCPAQARPVDLIAQGFLAEVRSRKIFVDVFFPDLTLAHALDASWLAQVQGQIVAPGSGKSYREIWFAGISLGAWHALRFAAAQPSMLAGLVLIAPYAGTGDVLQEIEAAGGPASWAQAASTGLDDERAWWRWLARRDATHTPRLPIYLAAGAQDRFGRGQRLLASLLDPELVRFVPGQHDWETWQSLWQHWLDHGPLATSPIP
jgi:hypothetical protein